MPDENVPSRDVVYLEPISDPLLAFFWARLDEAEDDAKSSGPAIEFYDGGQWRRQADMTLADVRAKKAILDDYANACRTRDQDGGVYSSDYLAADGEARVLRDVIKQLATVHAGHPDYDEAWRP